MVLLPSLLHHLGYGSVSRRLPTVLNRSQTCNNSNDFTYKAVWTDTLAGVFIVVSLSLNFAINTILNTEEWGVNH